LKKRKVKKVWKLGDIRLYECPLSWISQDTNMIIDQIFLTVDTPALFFPGAWSDQPAWFVEAWKIYKRVQFEELSKDGN